MTILDNYIDVVAFFEEYGISTAAINRSSYRIRKKELKAFSLNLPYDLKTELEKQSNVLYRCETLKWISLRKVRVSKDDSGKRNGYRCIIIDVILSEEGEQERYIFVLETYTHQQKHDLKKNEQEKYKKLTIELEKKLIEEGA